MLKLIVWLRNQIACFRLSRMRGVSIASGSRVNCKNVIIKPNCRLAIGKGSIVDGTIAFDREESEIKIGNRSFMGSSMLVCAQQIDIGDDVLISWGCTIVDHNSHAIAWHSRMNDVTDWYCGKKDWSAVAMAPVRIENRAWIGFNVVILKGVTIGEGAIVGAGSVVTRDVAPYTVVAGNPAALIKEIPLAERQ